MDSDAEAEEIASDEEVAGVDDDQAYSVDFEEDLVPSPVKPAKAKPAPAPIKAVAIPPPVKVAPPPPPPAVDDDDEEPDYGDDEFENDDDNGGYGDASFENESGRASSPRHHVNLSVPTRPPSPPRTIEKSPPKPTKPSQLPPSPRLARIEEEATPPTREASRYIRQLETQLLDENDDLKHQHDQLLRANSDLKNELRFLQQRHVDEKRLRSEKFQQKKKRADERRLQHELVLATTKQTLQDVEAKFVALEAAMATQTQALEALQATYDACDKEKRVVEDRHRVLSDKYQEALQDIHTLNGKLEAAVDSRQQTQHKYEMAQLDHKVAIEVVEQRCLVKMQCMQEAIDKAKAEREKERLELPENYRLIVEAHRERYEKLEEKLLQDKRDMDDKATRERDRFDKALSLAQNLWIQAEERADARIRDEAIKVFRERDAIDDQRRQLLTSLATQNARLDEERGKLDALRTQLEEKRLKLVQDEITVEAQAKQCHDRLLQLARDEDIVNSRKREVMALSASTLEKSRTQSELARALEQLQVAHAELQDKYNVLSRQATQQTADNDHKFQLVEREKSALERANAALGHEKLQLAKARMECRQMMEGTRKLDYLLRQQAALGNIYVHPPASHVKPPASWSVAFDADKEASMY